MDRRRAILTLLGIPAAIAAGRIPKALASPAPRASFERSLARAVAAAGQEGGFVVPDDLTERMIEEAWNRGIVGKRHFWRIPIRGCRACGGPHLVEANATLAPPMHTNCRSGLGPSDIRGQQIHHVVVDEWSAEVQVQALTPEDHRLIHARELAVEDIARAYRIDPDIVRRHPTVFADVAIQTNARLGRHFAVALNRDRARGAGRFRTLFGRPIVPMEGGEGCDGSSRS